jgi:hypothetical protein
LSRRIIPCSQIDQARPISPLAGEAVIGAGAARRGQRRAEGLVGTGRRDRNRRARQLADAAERVAQVDLPAAWLLFTDAGDAVEVGVRAVRKDLRQAGVQVEGVVGWDAIDGLAEPVPQSVIGKAVG